MRVGSRRTEGDARREGGARRKGASSGGKGKKRVFERRQGDKVQEVDEVHKAEKGAVYKKEEV